MHNLEYKLLYHCAPTIYGVKSANLFSLQNITDEDAENTFRYYKALLNKCNLEIKILCRCSKNVLFYVYNPLLLKARISDKKISDFLSGYGYTELSDTERVIEHLHSRITSSNSFPHEIGIFLDYPLTDVIGFIENKGQNFKYSGFWKVYGNVNKTLKLFNTYNRCRDDACSKLRSGLSVSEVLLSA